MSQILCTRSRKMRRRRRRTNDGDKVMD